MYISHLHGIQCFHVFQCFHFFCRMVFKEKWWETFNTCWCSILFKLCFNFLIKSVGRNGRMTGNKTVGRKNAEMAGWRCFKIHVLFGVFKFSCFKRWWQNCGKRNGDNAFSYPMMGKKKEWGEQQWEGGREQTWQDLCFFKGGANNSMHVMPWSLLKRGVAPKGAHQSLDDQLWHVKILGKWEFLSNDPFTSIWVTSFYQGLQLWVGKWLK